MGKDVYAVLVQNITLDAKMQAALTKFGRQADSGLWFKVQEAAKALGFTNANIYYHIDAGNMDAIRIGGQRGHIWIPRYELERWLKKRGMPALPTSPPE